MGSHPYYRAKLFTVHPQRQKTPSGPSLQSPHHGNDDHHNQQTPQAEPLPVSRAKHSSLPTPMRIPRAQPSLLHLPVPVTRPQPPPFPLPVPVSRAQSARLPVSMPVPGAQPSPLSPKMPLSTTQTYTTSGPSSPWPPPPPLLVPASGA